MRTNDSELSRISVYAFERPVVRAAIDHIHVKLEATIVGAGEIAFFPPMTGG